MYKKIFFSPSQTPEEGQRVQAVKWEDAYNTSEETKPVRGEEAGGSYLSVQAHRPLMSPRSPLAFSFLPRKGKEGIPTHPNSLHSYPHPK